MSWKAWVAAAAIVSASAAPARAGELWLGAFAHDVTFLGEAVGIGASGRERGVDIQLGWRSDRIESWRPVGKPSGYVFASINAEGDTSFVAAGFSWTVDFGKPGGWSFHPGLGIAVHDGYDELPDFRDPSITPEERARRIAMRNEHTEFGSKVLFQPELMFRWQATPATAVELGYVHLSHGQILGHGKNQGLDDVGVRVFHRLGRVPTTTGGQAGATGL